MSNTLFCRAKVFNLGETSKGFGNYLAPSVNE